MRRLPLLALAALLSCSSAFAGTAADGQNLYVLRIPVPPTESAGPARRVLSEEQVVRELFLWSLARMPTEKELAVAVDFVKSYGPDRTGEAQDLMWVLINRKLLPVM